MALHVFSEGSSYSRKDVLAEIGIEPVPTGGPWFTGYTSFHGEHFIFCNVGVAGRTGHDYANRWEADNLRWYGKTRTTADQPQIRAMVAGNEPVHLFHRSDDRGRFTYAGMVRAVEVRSTKPVEVLWTRVGGSTAPPMTEEVLAPERFVEGATRRVTVNAYERNPAARAKCIRHYGAWCRVCGFDFEKHYGEIGRGFIHVHHLKSLASVGYGYEVDPIEDLLPVCPNCHAMLHSQDPPLQPEELRRILENLVV